MGLNGRTIASLIIIVFGPTNYTSILSESLRIGRISEIRTFAGIKPVPTASGATGSPRKILLAGIDEIHCFLLSLHFRALQPFQKSIDKACYCKIEPRSSRKGLFSRHLHPMHQVMGIQEPQLCKSSYLVFCIWERKHYFDSFGLTRLDIRAQSGASITVQFTVPG
ncbi:unnamed protein product [Fraxinus pennsylvanica]|uniref:Uncharacterized protein n=1 Tax=Fraxinus pennsylvanica TaxID=56036 RepID=A0AAD2EBJ8_9LAMI|nr:unnamed protein product [Fraxinus pennsylvanica]